MRDTAAAPAAAVRIAREVTMCNFELAPDQLRLRRLEMIALGEQRRLARAMKPARVRRARSPRRRQLPVSGPVQLSPAPVFRS